MAHTHFRGEWKDQRHRKERGHRHTPVGCTLGRREKVRHQGGGRQVTLCPDILCTLDGDVAPTRLLDYVVRTLEKRQIYGLYSTPGPTIYRGRRKMVGINDFASIRLRPEVDETRQSGNGHRNSIAGATRTWALAAQGLTTVPALRTRR